jgi:hypothetical protein
LPSSYSFSSPARITALNNFLFEPTPPLMAWPVIVSSRLFPIPGALYSSVMGNSTGIAAGVSNDIDLVGLMVYQAF